VERILGVGYRSKPASFVTIALANGKNRDLQGERFSMMVRSRAPLRVGLAGGGTDVSPYCDEFGGAILNATIGHYAYASIEPLPAGEVRFQSEDQSQIASYPCSEIPLGDGNLDLHKHVHAYAIRWFNHGHPLSLCLKTRVDVPSGSGLGGSSTLVVAALKAYAEWFSYPLDDYELAHAAYIVEREEAGLRGGRQDQYAAAFGGFNFMEFGRNGQVLVNPLRIRQSVVSELEASMILYYSGASRASQEIIAEQSRNVEERNLEAIEAMHLIKHEAVRMKESLLRGDFGLLHEVLRSSWEAKRRMATMIVNERMEMLYETALRAGAYCAKISGAGGGGFMIFLADPMRKNRVVEALQRCNDAGVVCGSQFTHNGAQAWRVPQSNIELDWSKLSTSERP
jgi:D-glycero-alpha-D-manno-heptose-7-phosphate kinase